MIFKVSPNSNHSGWPLFLSWGEIWTLLTASSSPVVLLKTKHLPTQPMPELKAYTYQEGNKEGREKVWPQECLLTLMRKWDIILGIMILFSTVDTEKLSKVSQEHFNDIFTDRCLSIRVVQNNFLITGSCFLLQNAGLFRSWAIYHK